MNRNYITDLYSKYIISDCVKKYNVYNLVLVVVVDGPLLCGFF